MEDNVEFLRAQAAKCRRLAKMMTRADVARTLTQMAEDYDTRADTAEEADRKAPDRPA